MYPSLSFLVLPCKMDRGDEESDDFPLHHIVFRGSVADLLCFMKSCSSSQFATELAKKDFHGERRCYYVYDRREFRPVMLIIFFHNHNNFCD